MEKATFGAEPKVFHLGWAGELSKPGKLKHDGVLTVAVREKAPQLLVMGFTFCAPTDQFDKKVGKDKALDAMRHRPLRFRYIGNPFRTLHEVVRALCLQEFDELGHFCGYHLDHVLFTMKTVPKAAPGGAGVDNVLEKVCRVPGWAKEWWMERHGFGGGLASILDLPLAKLHEKLSDRGIGIKIERVSKRSPMGRILTDILKSREREQHDLPPELKEVLDKVFQDIRCGGPLGRF